MPSKIRVLSDDTINKIAAGEVIENPSSVVKELVENALDAGATEISIEIKGGGRQLIRITDNGCGMNKDDALLSLERHATSKLREIDELNGVGTMGFRGEAVPSIASISKFTLFSREHEKAEMGTLLIVDGGKICTCSPVECAFGTTIEVKDLFFNVPVRKKFQKSPAYDTAEIQRIVTQIALGNPTVQFKLISNQETLISVSGSKKNSFLEDLGERIRQLLGAEFYNSLIPLQGERADCHVEGYIGNPTATRHNRSGQHLFIHRRGVIVPLISFAVRDGYGTMLSTGRHPLYVMHLTIPPHLLDVNVHPQKREVRLRQERVLKELIIFSVESALQKGKCISTCNQPQTHRQEAPPLFEPIPRVFSREYSPFEYRIESDLIETKDPFSPNERPYQMPILGTQYDQHAQPTDSSSPADTKNQTSPSPLQKTENAVFFATPTLAPMQNHKPLKALGMIQKFIIAFEGDGSHLVLIDQRAAHARIIYEKFLNNKPETLELQMLLIPHLLELSASEASFLREQLTSLQEAGIHIKEFGPSSFVIDALPQIFGNIDIHKLVDEIVKNSYEGVHSKAFENELKKKLAQSASRAAITSETRLSLMEAQHLLDQLMACQYPKQCPYGNVTFVKLTSSDIAKLFHS